MSEMSSTSVSAAAIFSAEESCGRLPNRKDIVYIVGAWYKTSLSMEKAVICFVTALTLGGQCLDFAEK